MMAQATREKNTYRGEFEALSESLRGNEPSWLARLRGGAFEQFEAAGFPTTDEEDWKYTNVAPIARVNFRAAVEPNPFAPDAEAIGPFLYAESRQSRLVFVNGIYRPELSSLEALPEGVVAVDLAAAITDEQVETVRWHLTRSAEHSNESFTALNTAFMRSGAYLFVPRGVTVESPVHLLFLSTRSDVETFSCPRVLVIAERQSALTVIESYASVGDAAYFTNAVTEIFVADDARVTHYKVQNESDEAFHISSTRAELGRASAYDLTTVTLGARLSRHGIEVRMDREGAECWVDGLYLVGTGQHADTHSLIDHRRSHCTSHQNYKGILDGKSRAVFNGRVFVHRDAQKTDAAQSNKNLLLSNEARVDTKPQLEIFADDVKCAHGTTVGQLEEEELFYLASRGLHADLARNLLTYGFAEEIVEKIGIDSIKAQLDAAILNRLHARLEA
jgi:Fe-S cluster assembly protein SufD